MNPNNSNIEVTAPTTNITAINEQTLHTEEI